MDVPESNLIGLPEVEIQPPVPIYECAILLPDNGSAIGICGSAIVVNPVAFGPAQAARSAALRGSSTRCRSIRPRVVKAVAVGLRTGVSDAFATLSGKILEAPGEE